ncbi:MAG: carbamoyl phosphate synthase small subunit [Clostridia bacterium]|nr:carbamoyl phosphate synthase small subunit [Clostridia bacterium]
MAEKAYIILEDGHVFCGKRFGAESDAIGELVFTTGMGGYIETLTDETYQGQIVMQTFPLIGNCGMIFEDVESKKSYLSAYIVKEWCTAPSNFRLEQDLDSYLKEQGIPGVYDVDTREITRILRENGTMTAKIVSELPENWAEGLKEFKLTDAVSKVSSPDSKTYKAAGDKKYTVALYDFGSKSAIVKALAEKGCDVITLPYTASSEDILNTGADGVVIGNGPGDPMENTKQIEEIKKIFGKIPMLGVGLGHQLMALAQGAKTEKHTYGHRGANQPVKYQGNGRTYITNQNHGFIVDIKSLEKIGASVTFVNANDGTCEGAEYNDKNAFSVQFIPAGKDKDLVYDRFAEMMGGAH